MAGKSSKPKRAKGKSSKKKGKKAVKDVDILSPAAMLNAYYVCHNAPACLELRGFPWPGSPKKKGKKRNLQEEKLKSSTSSCQDEEPDLTAIPRRAGV
nr:small lysine-rich protein 1 [Anas platyrhynchos]XP_027317542.1 small lysine-rich protein 1 [Anas platyrhynchos]XP_027317549.1 small lysine-rich protein 1 [Anas platyrhynchos]XP_027317558.1 small lysine-rich protein 1 [Anas platyrhynchos]XP_027317564.1 small lysine-rich protein 1 [Anas platyrhynchos]XP_038043063.1 small lysine-rich protein 1 [Anas platyrhynchos]|eukprot:XP_027317537.1 small lysine-rich protein 1 [Anas platyrhynchos]